MRRINLSLTLILMCIARIDCLNQVWSLSLPEGPATLPLVFEIGFWALFLPFGTFCKRNFFAGLSVTSTRASYVNKT